MAAYKAAIDDGADGFECDVRLTKDNQVILWHDSDMQRIAGKSVRIADSNFSEIKRLYPQAMTLEELLILARDNKKELAIETKHPVPSGSAVEKKVMELLQQEKQVAQVFVMSFSWLALENIRRIDPHQQTVALLRDKFSFAMRRLITNTPSYARSVLGYH